VLVAGTHNYICNVTGTQNYTSASNSSTYHVNKADGSQILTLTADSSWTVTDGAQTNVSCTANTNQVAPQLYRNGSSVNNPDVETLAMGTYNYTCNATETENYTAGEVSNTLTVTPKTPSQCNLTFSLASPTTYGNTLTASCTCTNPEAPAKLYRNGVDVTSLEKGTPILLPAGNHSYACNVSETENYSAASDLFTYQVNKATSSCNLTFSPLSPQTYGSSVTASCTCTNPEAPAKLYRDGVNVTSSENGTEVVLAAGTHNYICNVTGTQNYSAASNLSTYQIDYHPCDLNHDGITIRDYKDLMITYKCFLGIKNCDKISFQEWNSMKEECKCFAGN
jgi:hypothetical protein